LRRNQTDAERLLWARLRDRRLHNTKFRRQVAIQGYFIDFACDSAKLIIELDDGQHLENEADARRTEILEMAGYSVLRFWNNNVMTNLDGVLQRITEMLEISGQHVEG
jgi:very-short-patch-repair endonuclease